jgi:hypothetical protein
MKEGSGAGSVFVTTDPGGPKTWIRNTDLREKKFVFSFINVMSVSNPNKHSFVKSQLPQGRLTICSTRYTRKMSLSLALPENDTLMAGQTMSQWCRGVVITRRGGQLTQVHSPDQHL